MAKVPRSGGAEERVDQGLGLGLGLERAMSSAPSPRSTRFTGTPSAPPSGTRDGPDQHDPLGDAPRVRAWPEGVV